MVANIPSSKHRLFLADGVRLDLSSSLTLEALKAQYGLPDDFILPPTYTLNSAKTDSALQAKLDLIPENKGVITQGTLLLKQGATITQQKYELLRALDHLHTATMMWFGDKER